jgi:flagellar M-ring protein FliF
MATLPEGLKALGPMRLAAMGAVALGVLALMALLILRGGGERMAILYGDMDLRDAAQAVDQLERAHIPHQLAVGGSEILVPADRVAEARLLLARAGLPASGTVGYELFDRTDPLTATPFQLDIDRTRALEGELARTIRAIQGVRGVRVHLVLPKREPFSREQQDAQASVLLTMAGAARMDRESVQAILNLLAAAVPGLKPKNIAVVDSRGNVLARAGAPVGPDGGALSGEEIRLATEIRLSRAVEEMLERSLGPGHVRAEAAVEMNFDHLHETEERYDPDGQIVRSQQSVATKSKSTEGNNTVSVQNNLPNADAGNGTTSGNEEQRQEDTTNYEISKTVRTIVHDEPQIKRISMAVVVDGITARGPDGKPAWRERSPEELARITALVKTAIGYDEKRGDHVEVATLRFAEEEETAPYPHTPFGLPLERADLVHLVQTLLLGLVGILSLLLVLRPMVQRLTAVDGPALPSHAAIASVASDSTSPALKASTPPLLTGPKNAVSALSASTSAVTSEIEQMVNIANIEGQMRASSLRKISQLVENHPEESLAIVRRWLAEETQ